MRWDDATFTGQRGPWRWFVSRQNINRLSALVIREHLGHHLSVVTFDCEAITPEGLAIGWSNKDGAMISPPLSVGLEIPSDHHNEWYIFSEDQPSLGEFERFAIYGGFNLADPHEMASSFDPTWDRSALDWLYPIQERFWRQLERLAPVSYVASGDNDVIVTRHPGFAEAICRSIGSS